MTTLKKRFLTGYVAFHAVCQFAFAADPIVYLRPTQHLTGSNVLTLGNLGLRQSFSFSFWIKPNPGSPAWAAVLDYRHTAKKSFAFHQKNQDANHFAFGVHSKDGVHGVYARLKSTEWQHVALIKSNDFMAIFVNAKSVDRTAVSSMFRIDYKGDEVLTIGGWGYGDRRWLGAISCIRVYDEPLNEHTVKILSQQTECKNDSK
jgi:hypothetical protein